MKIQKHFIRLTSLLIILSLLFALSSCFVGEQVILSKEEITANMEAETNTERAYVTTYLRKWDFPRFTTSKLQGIEIVFRDYFAHEIPSSYEMTKMVVSLFLDNFYDKIDLTDEVTVTDALIQYTAPLKNTRCTTMTLADPSSVSASPLCMI